MPQHGTGLPLDEVVGAGPLRHCFLAHATDAATHLGRPTCAACQTSSHSQRSDGIDLHRKTVLRHVKVILGLQVQPELR